MSFLTKIVTLAMFQIDAMAYQRKVALRTLDDLHDEIAIHLFLVVHYPDHEAFQHWLKELRAWHGKLTLRNKGKGRSPNFTKKILMQHLWENPLGGQSERNTVARIVREKELPEVAIRQAELKKAVEKFADTILLDQTFNV